MNKNPFGTKQNVDIKSIFPREEADFTPWMAENLQYVSDAVKLDLEFVDREVKLEGSSREADIIAKVTGTDDYVVIENQYGTLDPDHAFRACMYAINKKRNIDIVQAKYVICISEKVDPQIKSVLEYFNTTSPDDAIKFFALEFSTYKIDSVLDIIFTPVVAPDNWDDTSYNMYCTENEPTELRVNQKKFWNYLIENAKHKPLSFAFGNIRDRSLQYLQIPFATKFNKSNIALGLVINSKKGTLSVKLEFNSKFGENNKAIFDKLYELYKNDTEKYIHENISWNRCDDFKTSNIMVSLPFDVKDETSYSIMISEILDITERMHNFFKIRVENI